jgi:hypothetical protein
MDEQKKKEKLSAGVAVLILLAALTLGEFWIGAVAHVWWAPLLGIAALKAFFVVRDYMHIGRVFAGDEESH